MEESDHLNPEMVISRSDIDSFEKRYRTNLINCLSGFKSLNLIATRSVEGVANLGLYSQVIHVGANPPLQGILFRPAVVPRHTLENIYATREFTINQVHRNFYEKAHWTSARWDENEFGKVGLTEEYGERNHAPYVRESVVKALMTFKERHIIQTNQTTLLVGEIIELVIQDDIIGSDGFLDLEKAETVTVSGLDKYHTTKTLARLEYAKPDNPPRPL